MVPLKGWGTSEMRIREECEKSAKGNQIKLYNSYERQCFIPSSGPAFGERIGKTLFSLVSFGKFISAHIVMVPETA